MIDCGTDCAEKEVHRFQYPQPENNNLSMSQNDIFQISLDLNKQKGTVFNPVVKIVGDTIYTLF